MGTNEYQKEWLKARRARGICRRCDRPLVTETLCEVHRLDALSKAKESYIKTSREGRCPKCRDAMTEKGVLCKKCKISMNMKRSANVLQTKAIVMSHYGGKCSCCNTEVLTFLALDHIDGGGEQHRKELGRPCGYHFYKWIIEKGYPEGYQVLCHNCHFAKTVEGACHYHDHATADAQKILD